MQSELCRSKSLCERQSRQFDSQRDKLLQTHSKQLAELRLAAEHNQTRLRDELHVQIELYQAQKDKEFCELRQRLLTETDDVQRQAKQQADCESKVQHGQLAVISLQAIEQNKHS